MDMRIFCLRMNLLCDKINGSKLMIMIILVMSSGSGDMVCILVCVGFRSSDIIKF